MVSIKLASFLPFSLPFSHPAHQLIYFINLCLLLSLHLYLLEWYSNKIILIVINNSSSCLLSSNCRKTLLWYFYIILHTHNIYMDIIPAIDQYFLRRLKSYQPWWYETRNQSQEKKGKKPTKMWRLNNRPLKNQSVIEESKNT